MNWKDAITVLIISLIVSNRRGPNAQCGHPPCCLSYTANTISADALVNLGSIASAGRHGIDPKAGIFRLQHQKSFNDANVIQVYFGDVNNRPIPGLPRAHYLLQSSTLWPKASRKTMIHVSCIFCIVASDDLTMEEANTSAADVLN